MRSEGGPGRHGADDAADAIGTATRAEERAAMGSRVAPERQDGRTSILKAFTALQRPGGGAGLSGRF